MKLVHVVVEGPTELGFIDRVLGPYFLARGVRLFPHKVQPEAVRPFVEPPDDPASIAEQLLGIRETCGGAERINDKRETSPSHRLHRVWPAYNKALHGPAVIESIGLPALRGACPHFGAWIVRPENLCQAPRHG